MMRFYLSIRNRLILTVLLIILGLGGQLVVNNIAQNNIDYLQEKQSEYLERDAVVASALNNLILSTNDIINIKLEDYLSGVLQNTSNSQIQAVNEFEQIYDETLNVLQTRNVDNYNLTLSEFQSLRFVYEINTEEVVEISNIVKTSGGAYSNASFLQIQVREVLDNLRDDSLDLKSVHRNASINYFGNYSSYTSSIASLETDFSTLENSVLGNGNLNYVETVMAQVFAVNSAIDNLREFINEINLHVVSIDVTDESYLTDLVSFATDIDLLISSVNSEINELQDLSLDLSDETIIDTIENDFNSTILLNVGTFSVSLDDYSSIRSEIGNYQNSLFYERLNSAQDAFITSKSIYDAEHAEFITKFTELETSMISGAQNTTFLITSLLGLIVLVLAIPTILRISVATRRLERNFRKVSSGDLSFPLKDIKEGDEFENLELSFNKLVINLKDIVGVIQESSTQLAGISEELAAGTEEASASLNSVSGTIRTISIGAQTQSNLLNGLSENMLELRKEIQLATSGIEQASANVSKLAQRSNILGLNASISAAKSGGSASGFGIVANEIRDLAINSRASSNQITNLVEQIISRLRYLTKAMTQDLESVKSLASNTAEGSAQTNSTASEQVIMLNEISDTSNDLADLANSLDVLLSRFKLK